MTGISPCVVTCCQPRGGCRPRVHRDPIRNVPKMCDPGYRRYPSYCSVVRRYSSMTYCPAPAPPRWKDWCRPIVCQPQCLGGVPFARPCCVPCCSPCCSPGPTIQPVQIVGCTAHHPVC